MSNRSLTDKDIDEIRYLFYIKKYSKISLSRKYNCSITTISLWIPPVSKYREYKIHCNKINKVNKCHKCNKSIKTHKRCPNCTILLHDKPCDCIRI